MLEQPGIDDARHGRSDVDPGHDRDVEAILDIQDHMEFLIDRQGYLRARWFPGEWEGWDDIKHLVTQAEILAREPARPPAPNTHLPLK